MGLVAKGGIKDLSKEEIKDEALNQQELEFLLSRIKDMTFKGSELEILTKVVLKLQNRYIKITDTKEE
jgi:hypothetical protein